MEHSRGTVVKHSLAVLLAWVGLSSGPASAETFAPIKDLPTFLQLVEGRDLRIGLYNLTLQLSPDGQITGSALGWDITGSWRWEDGYFCRQMDWSGYAIKDNCQLVEAEGTAKMRFTVDQGAGDSATFKLR
jgi:hypothetical protein